MGQVNTHAGTMPAPTCSARSRTACGKGWSSSAMSPTRIMSGTRTPPGSVGENCSLGAETTTSFLSWPPACSKASRR